MKNNILKILVLVIFFIVLSEKITLLNIAVGLLIAVLVVTLNKEDLPINRYMKAKLISKWIKFVAKLFVEVVKANIQVAIITLSKDMDVESVMVTYKSVLKDEFLLTILANSITLTPGTMTVDIKGNKLLIHCLNKEYSKSLCDMDIEIMLKGIEGELNG
ncbi:MAG: Na+/H+ antiporter subunit E [Acidaminobacteraceae bacterium]